MLIMINPIAEASKFSRGDWTNFEIKIRLLGFFIGDGIIAFNGSHEKCFQTNLKIFRIHRVRIRSDSEDPL